MTGDVRRTYYGLMQTRAGLTAIGQALAQIEELTWVVQQYVERQVALESDSDVGADGARACKDTRAWSCATRNRASRSA